MQEQLAATIEVRTDLLEKSLADHSKSLKSLNEKVTFNCLLKKDIEQELHFCN